MLGKGGACRIPADCTLFEKILLVKLKNLDTSVCFNLKVHRFWSLSKHTGHIFSSPVKLKENFSQKLSSKFDHVCLHYAF